MTKRIFNPQEWIHQYDLDAMTPAQLVALINVLVDDTIDRPMSVEYYQQRLEAIGMLTKAALEKSPTSND